VKNRTVIIVVGVIVLVLGLAGAAVLLTGGDDENSSGVLAPGETTRPTYGDDVQENRPVEVSGAALPALVDGVADPAIGAAMPVVEGATFDGVALTVGGPTDGPTLYAFLAHWCPACNDEIPEMIQLRNRGGVPDGINVVAISTAVDNSGPNHPPSEWIVDMEWPSEWPVMADSVESTTFVVNGGGAFPYLVIADADGSVLARASGVKSAEDLATWINDALATAA
jgi:cytochrome c biogenesis protein CcmG, thiol:disulfide interchange protein DsbE